ncbi:MAG: heme-binding protein [Pseudomonadota bacterium]
MSYTSTLSVFRTTITAALLFMTSLALAQQPGYGTAVNLETAKKVAAGAALEAKKNNFKMAIAIVDNHGFPVYFEMLDDTQTGSANVAIQKARTAAMFRRPTKALEDGVAGGRNALLTIPDVVLLEGGEILVIDGKVVGAIGVSGGSTTQDGQVARAGAAVIK